MPTPPKARAVGINHIALEVGDIEEALAFLGRFLAFELRGRGPGRAFIDMGDQFLALTETDHSSTAEHRHFGIVVDDQAKALAALDTARIPRTGNRVVDPWGNRLEIVGYPDIQFTKAPHILQAMNLETLDKTPDAKAQLAKKGMAPEQDAAASVDEE